MGDSSENTLDFGFAFNDKGFSDRVLHIEIIPEDSLPHRNKKKLWFLRSKRCNDSASHALKVITLHISSPILAAKSPYFYRLFQNGMKESQQRDVTMRITSSEELPLMDVLNFMYKKTLNATTSSELLGVLMCADKFEVTCCMKYCIKVMLEGQMALERALLCLDLPSSLLASEIVQPLVDASKKVLVACAMDFNKYQEEAMKLSLPAIEVILESDGLHVHTEDVVFDFILRWARANYPKLEERREILTERLTRFISFPHMNTSKLKKILDYNDFDHDQLSKLVLEALCSKDEVPYGKHLRDPKRQRVYMHRMVKVVQLDFPWPRCVVYFNLTRDECANLFPSNALYSQAFLLGGHSFYLKAVCSAPHHFGLFVFGQKDCNIDFEFASIEKSSKDFQRKLKGCNRTLGDKGWGLPNLFGISWTDFMSDDSEYFIDGILHLRVDLTLNK